jgi:hypothetical protein
VSQTRITSLADENRNPVVVGDLLFNMAWSPSLKQHVAIAGIIDLTGDLSRENPTQAQRALDDFKRSLANQGIVVDAYLDLKDNTIKGEITRQTDFLIRGEPPVFPGSGAINDDDPRNRRRSAIVEQMTSMEQTAVQYGVPVIRLREFLNKIGYRMPRTVSNEKPDLNFRPAPPAPPSVLEREFRVPKEDDIPKMGQPNP